MPHAPCLIPHATRLHTSRRQISGPNEMELFCCRAFSWLDFHFVVNKFIKRIPLPCFHLGPFRFRAADRIGRRAAGIRLISKSEITTPKTGRAPKNGQLLERRKGNLGQKNPENQQRCRGQTGQVTRPFRPPQQHGTRLLAGRLLVQQSNLAALPPWQPPNIMQALSHSSSCQKMV